MSSAETRRNAVRDRLAQPQPLPQPQPWLSRRDWLQATSGYLASSLAVAAGGSLFLPTAQAQQVSKPQLSTAKWEVLYLPPRQRRASIQPLPEGSPLKLVKSLDLAGPAVGHPHQLGKFAINGEFGVAGALLTRVTGANAAIEVATAENFEMEGMIQAEGTGGWFILLGWKDGTGNVLYQMGTRVSGSPWYHCYFKDGVADKDSQAEFGRIEWKGGQPVVLTVSNQTVSLKVGTFRLAHEMALRDYAGGQVLIGTYDTQYGPRDVRIQSLRIKYNKAP